MKPKTEESVPTPAWEERFQEAVSTLKELLVSAHKTEKLTRAVERLRGKLKTLEEQPPSLIVPVTTFAPEPFDLLQPIQVVVQPSDGEYVASFFDANVNASGCTETEAVANVKDVLLGLFEHLSSLPAKRLGPGPAKQLAVLKTVVRKRS
jgi:predicted RNase H-like HicB family nuclease